VGVDCENQWGTRKYTVWTECKVCECYSSPYVPAVSTGLGMTNLFFRGNEWPSEGDVVCRLVA